MATRKSPSTAPKAQPRSKRTRRVRKPKLIQIDGHQLTPELYRLYEHRLESRQRINRELPQERIKELALSDTIYEFRFSGSAKEKLSPIYAQLSAAALAVMALGQHYPFYDRHARHVRLTGCDTLNRLAAEVQHLGAKIHAIGEAIRYEDREHLQDWIKRQEALEASTPYGLAPGVSS